MEFLIARGQNYVKNSILDSINTLMNKDNISKTIHVLVIFPRPKKSFTIFFYL